MKPTLLAAAAPLALVASSAHAQANYRREMPDSLATKATIAEAAEEAAEATAKTAKPKRP